MLVTITFDTDTGKFWLDFRPPERRGRNNRIGLAIMRALTLPPYSRTTRELIEFAWPDPEDEPTDPDTCIRHAITQLNRGYLPINYPYLRVVGEDRRWRLVIHRPHRVQTPGSE